MPSLEPQPLAESGRGPPPDSPKSRPVTKGWRAYLHTRPCVLVGVCVITITMAVYRSAGVGLLRDGGLPGRDVAGGRVRPHRHRARWKNGSGDALFLPFPEGSLDPKWKDVKTKTGLTDILNLKRPQYRADYKNPCWVERAKGVNVDTYWKKQASVEASALWPGKKVSVKPTWRLRCLPYFLIVGQPKSGTTDLWQKLGLHQQLVLSNKKEPHWWTRGRYGIARYVGSSLEKYIQVWDKVSPLIHRSKNKDTGFHPRVTGEASASTFWDNRNWRHLVENQDVNSEPRVLNAHHIRHLLPDVKILVIVRNPVDRLYSDYLYFNRGTSPRKFHERCVASIRTFRECMGNSTLRSCVYRYQSSRSYGVRLIIGMYSVFLSDWCQIFPWKQIHVVNLDEYSSNRTGVLAGIHRFLDLEPILNTAKNINRLPVSNRRRVKDRVLGPMLNETRRILQEFYGPYNRQFADMLNDDRYLYES